MKNFLIIISLLALTIEKTTAQCKSKYDISSDMVGECKTVESCTGAAISSDCSQGLICCVPDIKPVYAESSLISLQTFLKIVGDTERNTELYYHFADSLVSAEITNNFQLAAYLSQLIGETNYFKSIESTQTEKDIDPAIGNNKTGDGLIFRGRGGILLRGKNNYFLANNKLTGIRSGRNLIRFNIFNEPDKASLPSIAFKIAAWFWRENAFVIKGTEKARKSSLNELADGTFLSFAQLTYSLSNKIKSLKDRAIINEKILSELRHTSMKRGQGVKCELSDQQKGYAVPICLIDFKKPYCGCEGKYEVLTCPYGPLADKSCRNSAMIKCCVENCYSDMDLVVAIDTSGSIGDDNWKKARQFVINLIDQLKIADNATRMAVVEFNNKASILINLLNGTNSDSVKKVVNEFKYKGGQTNTAQALQYINDLVMREDMGMRPLQQGIPKVVITITDGLSDNPGSTKTQANRLKRREINMISVGVGDNSVTEELLTLSSTPNNQYYVENYDKILNIINEIRTTTCQQPATIQEQTNVVSKVEKDTYKYFKYSIKSTNRTLPRNFDNETSYMDQFTIELQEILGSCNLFFSFEEKNPKSENDYGKENDMTTEPEQNFFEDEDSYKRVRRSETNLRNVQSLKSSTHQDNEAQKSKFYTISNPTGSDTLYFSLMGLEEENSFQVLVFNRTTVVNETTSTTTTTENNLFSGKDGIYGNSFNLVAGLFISLVLNFF